MPPKLEHQLELLKADVKQDEGRSVPKETDWAYLAAFIDGEGCIQGHRASYEGSKPRPMITIVQKYPASLHFIAKTFGGEVKQQPSSSRYLWRASAKEFVRYIIVGCLPYAV